MKGLFIPGITVEMFRNGSLESVAELMADGEIYDIDYQEPCKEQEPILDKIKAEIGMYEADCRLQGGTDECEKCNSNIFGSIYRIIDKYKLESEGKE